MTKTLVITAFILVVAIGIGWFVSSAGQKVGTAMHDRTCEAYKAAGIADASCK